MQQVPGLDEFNKPIIIALGANLTSERWGPPRQTLEAALQFLTSFRVEVVKISRWYESAPVPVSDQPWYVNGVAQIRTNLDPETLLLCLHKIEAEFGRMRAVRNEARAIDLDLIAYGDQVIDQPDGLTVPHPRLAERAFVLLPIRDILPNWREPRQGRSLTEMIASLPADQSIRAMAGQA